MVIETMQNNNNNNHKVKDDNNNVDSKDPLNYESIWVSPRDFFQPFVVLKI